MTILFIAVVMTLLCVFLRPESDAVITAGPTATASPSPEPTPTKAPLPDGFADVSDYIPDAVIALSYYSEENFTGRRVTGYEANRAILTVEACQALQKAAAALREQGYRLCIFDAYRPVDAVQAFVIWGQDESDILKKEEYYPGLSKKALFNMYIATQSKHSRGSTVDLTIVHPDGEPVEMGCHFDYFDEIAHTFSDQISPAVRENRMILRQAMEAAGFEGSGTEWWHFHLIGEPYPDTAFNFYVR